MGLHNIACTTNMQIQKYYNFIEKAEWKLFEKIPL